MKVGKRAWAGRPWRMPQRVSLHLFGKADFSRSGLSRTAPPRQLSPLSFRTLGPWRMPAHERQPAAVLLSSCSMESWCTLVVHGSTTSTLQHDGTTACTTRSIVQDDINGSLAMPCAFLARGAYGLHGAEAASQKVDSRVRHFGTVDTFLVMKHDCACALCGA